LFGAHKLARRADVARGVGVFKLMYVSLLVYVTNNSCKEQLTNLQGMMARLESDENDEEVQRMLEVCIKALEQLFGEVRQTRMPTLSHSLN